MGLFSSDSKTNPFAEAEERMHHHMMKAEGDTVDETFVRKMIAHHQGAVETSQILLQQGSDPQLKQMVEKSVSDQEKEIRELQSWLQTNGKSVERT